MSEIVAAVVAALPTIGTVCKYASDFLKLRKDRASSEKNETIRDYIEACRRQEHAEALGRFDLVGVQLAGFEELLTTLSTVTEEQANQVLSAIEQGNFAILSTLQLRDEATHAKLDQIIHLLRVEPRQLFPGDPQSWQDKAISDFEDRYLERARREFSRLEMLGVPGTRDFHQELSIAYVSLELGAVGRNAEEKPRRAEEAFTRYRQLTIRGPAGSGKTTLLRWIGLQCALAARNRYIGGSIHRSVIGNTIREFVTHAATTITEVWYPKHTDTSRKKSPWHSGIPIFVPLRKLKGSDLGRPNEKKLHEYAFDAGTFEDAPNGWLQRVFEEGRAVLLLDGLDELPSRVRKNFWGWLNDLLRQYPALRVVVTSRPLSAVEDDDSAEWQPSARFNHAELRDLSPEDRTVFIWKWHDAAKAVLTDPEKQKQLDKSREHLLDKLKDRANARVQELTKNPLMAGLICALYWRELRFPETRRELYEKSCDLLMVIRDETREIPVDDEFAGVKKVDRFYLAECLAWEMMQNSRADDGQNIEVREKDARLWLKNHLSNCEDSELKKATPKKVLDFLVQRSGLLRIPTKGYIDFHHRSFQEYLAACAAAVLNQQVSLAKNAGDDQWRETIILAANTHEGGVIFGRILINELLEEAKRESKEDRHRVCIALAAACLENAEKPPSDLRAAVEVQLRKIVPPRSQAEAEAIAVAGNAIVPRLEFDKLKSKDRKVGKVLAACATALALIGTDQARRALSQKGYRESDRWDVVSAVCDCPGIDPLNVPLVLEMVKDGGILSPRLTQNIVRLDALANCSDLTAIRLFGTRQLNDLKPLAKLTGLIELMLTDCSGVHDLTPLTQLTNLQQLMLTTCERVSDLTPVSTLTKLIALTLDGFIGVSNFAPLAKLTKLMNLSLAGCTGLSDLTPLVELTNLIKIILPEHILDEHPPTLDLLIHRGVVEFDNGVIPL